MQLYTWHYMPLHADSSISSHSSVFAFSVASVVLLVLAMGGIWSLGQVAMVPSAVPAYMAVQDGAHNESLSNNTHAPQLRISASGPIWREISEPQRIILSPLRERWDTMGALAKRRWLVLADHYPKMGEAERTKLVSRMHTWASLSTQQRNQARLNFESTKRLSAKELQAKWDEYQALSDAEKQRLTEQARKARIAKKAKRRLAVPKEDVTPQAIAVETLPVLTPQAAPSVQLNPMEVPHPGHETPVVSAQPVMAPDTMPSVDLPPLPTPATPSTGSHDTHQAPAAAEPTPPPAQ